MTAITPIPTRSKETSTANKRLKRTAPAQDVPSAASTDAAEQADRTISEPDVRELLTKAQVCERLRLSERSLDKMLGRRDFPAPVRLGKRHYWIPAPVEHWLARKFAVQHAWVVS
jgi:predicted DNA-binding transcriptional regulator AlpA